MFIKSAFVGGLLENAIKEENNIVMIYSHFSREFLLNNDFCILRAFVVKNGDALLLMITFKHHK